MIGERGNEGVNFGLPLKLEGPWPCEGPSSLRGSLVAMSMAHWSLCY